MVQLYIIEDDEMIRKGLEEFFRWPEHNVEVVGSSSDGRIALKEILDQNVDVILTDIVLPGMSGIELAKALRAEYWPGEIIMMSAFQDVDYLRAALKTQSVDFLFKPMKLDELAAAMRNAVHRVQQRQGIKILSEPQWRVMLKEAFNNLNLDSIEIALQAAWVSVRFDKCVDEPIATRAARAFKICERSVCLEAAEDLCIKVQENILLAATKDDIARIYAEGSKNLLEILRHSFSEWFFAAELTHLIINDLPNAEPTLLATKMHISRSAFYRKFSHAFHSSLSDRIVHLRIRVASELLENSPLRIYEVAESVGYTDVNYFTRIFRQQIGVLPSKYRALVNNIVEEESEG